MDFAPQLAPRCYSAAAARAFLLAQMTTQQVATLIALRWGGDSGRRIVVMIGSVMAGVAGDAALNDKERADVLRGTKALVDNRNVLAGRNAARACFTCSKETAQAKGAGRRNSPTSTS